MNVEEKALVALVRLLDQHEVEYAIVGGLANAVWGEPRATLDVDAVVWVADDSLPSFLAWLASLLRLLARDPLAFARETRVVPAQSDDGVRIDVILGLLPFEHETIRRAVEIDIAGCKVRFATAEDLILMKIISDRERDLADAKGIAMRRAGELDLAYLGPRIAELARLLDRPEIARRWKEWSGQRSQ